MEKWIEIRKGGNFMEMAKKYGIDPLIARIIRNRDITDEKEITEYLYGGKEALHNPHLLKDADKAAEIIAEGIAEKKAMRIIGDYDIDGVSLYFVRGNPPVRRQCGCCNPGPDEGWLWNQ